MKCPECNASFSELRDICPACTLDLRDYKHERGFPVSFEDLTYEELLHKFPRSKQFETVLVEKEQDLFMQAYKEALHIPLREVSLGTASLGRDINRQEISLLFDVLEETLLETAKYVDDIQTSEAAFVESETLQKELDTLERAAEAPIFSLKGSAPGIGGSGQSVDTRLQTHSKAALKPVFLSSTMRILSAVIDGIVIGALSFFVAFFIQHAHTREVFAVTLSEKIIMYGDVLTLAAGLYIPISIVYLLVMLGMYRRTLGLFLVGGKLCSEEGRAPHLDSIIIRSLLAPISSILTGFLPLIMGTRGFHEKLSKTDILARS